MIQHLAYGKKGLDINLPEDHEVTIIQPAFPPSVTNTRQALEDALQHPYGSLPLHAFVKPTDRIGIVFNDITRPTPSRALIRAILHELPHIPERNITLFNALGSHRFNTPEELREILGDELVRDYRIVQSNAFDPTTQVYLGTTTRGHEIWLNRALWECDVKILTGLIEPHFFAGFSGGGKAILPGMAGIATIQGNHSAHMIGDPKARSGVTWDNPVWEEIQEVAHMVDRTFLMNVTLNKNKEVTGIFCGDLDEAYARGCDFARSTALAPFAEPFDIVISTNSGYPLDINLYQSVKGMSTAAQVVRQGGSIIMAVECSNGIPKDSMYEKMLRDHQSPNDLLEDIYGCPNAHIDQWQIQIQAMLQLRADVYIYSEGLSDDQIRSAMLIPSHSIEITLSDLLHKYGQHARICVLPEGPQVIPYMLQGAR